jgi:hypothetical protein
MSLWMPAAAAAAGSASGRWKASTLLHCQCHQVRGDGECGCMWGVLCCSLALAVSWQRLCGSHTCCHVFVCQALHIYVCVQALLVEEPKLCVLSTE